MRTNNCFMFIFASQHGRNKLQMPNLPRLTTCCPATEVNQKSPQIHQLTCKAEEKSNTVRSLQWQGAAANGWGGGRKRERQPVEVGGAVDG